MVVSGSHLHFVITPRSSEFLSRTNLDGSKNPLKHSLLATERSKKCIQQTDIGKLAHERNLIVRFQGLRNDVPYKVDFFPGDPYNTKVEWVMRKWPWLGRVVQWQFKLRQCLKMYQTKFWYMPSNPTTWILPFPGNNILILFEKFHLDMPASCFIYFLPTFS